MSVVWKKNKHLNYVMNQEMQQICLYVPGGGEQISINPAKSGQCHRDWHHPGKHPQELLPKRLNTHEK